jgi:serine/threonine protein kinase
MPTEAEAPTQRTIGNYDLIEKIAEGGMGAVYKGRHRGSGQIVAIKIVPPDTAKNAVLLKRFEMEFRAASVLDHPNIVKALDYNGLGTPFLVMEYVDGESLGQRVERGGPMDEATSVRLIAQVCDGLHKAHKQSLIHRDVKPDNILVNQQGIAKLTDLGLVKDTEGEQNLTRTGRGLGTPHFMAPEQFRNAKNADVKCDVYSLGATLYMMLTGEIPFAKTNPLDCWMKKVKNDFPAPRKINPKISERVDWAIRRAMSADPAQRPNTCREFVEDLTGNAAAVHGPPSTAVPQMAIPTSENTTTGDPTPPPSSMTIEDVLWYMVYRGPDGQQHTVKGLTSSIRDNIRREALGDINVIMVSREKAGPFQSLKQTPEFRDLLVNPQTIAPNKVAASRAPSPPAPGERTARLPSPDVPQTGKKSLRISPKRASAPLATGDARGFRFPDWTPWAAVGFLAVVVAALAYLVIRRG